MRRIPGNARQLLTTVFVPDRLATQLMASLAIATNTRSPMAGGREHYAGDSGVGVNRASGRTGPLQNFAGAAVHQVLHPSSVRVGAQGGPSSQPGFPSTGDAGRIPTWYGGFRGLERFGRGV